MPNPQTQNTLPTERNATLFLRRAAEVLLWTLVLCTCVAKFVPFSPEFPSGGLDPSWRFGMGQAIAQGMHFGTDVIFTFGPYASVYMRQFHPATDGLMLSATLYLAVAYWVAAFLAFRNAPRLWVLLFTLFLAGGLYLRDPLLFSLPLLLGLAVWNGQNAEHGWLKHGKSAPFSLALLFTPLGMLPLVKGSLLVLCCAVVALCATYLLSLRERRQAAACLLGPLAALPVFWLLSGQSFSVLPAYLTSMLPIVSGYTEAMAIPGPLNEIWAYLVASAVLACAILCAPMKWRGKALLFTLSGGYLFLSFKAGFVRHDGHAIIAAGSLGLAAIALTAVLRSRAVVAGLAFSFIAWGMIDYHYMQVSAAQFSENVSSLYRGAWQGAARRLTRPDSLRSEYDSAVRSLRNHAALPQLPGTADIYSFQQSDLIASGNRWAPRPVLQSYSAYTPALAELNRQHLLGTAAPDNIVFRVESLDGRLPAMDDGASWPALLGRYQPTGLLNDVVLLKKRAALPAAGADAARPLAVSELRFGEAVSVPKVQGKIFVQLDIKPSLLGRLVSFLYRPDQLQMTLKLQGGHSKTFRIISGMARAGFILSPMVEDTKEFLMLYGDDALLDEKRVESISIGTSSGSNLLWSNTYRVNFGLLPAKAPAEVADMLGLDQFADLPADLSRETAQCGGAIDVVNGGPVPTAGLRTSALLRMQGWLTQLPAPQRVVKQIYIVLTDAAGRRVYARTHVVQRPDVAAGFQQPELVNAGFVVNADLSKLQGKYKLGLAFEQDGRLGHCSQFDLPLVIGKSTH